MSLRWKEWGVALAVTVALGSLAPAAVADDNCANEFRSGKLYFSQKVFDKAVDRFANSVEICPEKGEYRARYAMALAQYASVLTEEAYVRASTKAEQDSLLAVAMDMFERAGAEFDSSAARDDSRKNLKFVRENRKHYWVEHYNLGLQLAKDENFNVAARELMVARMLDPKEMKAYQQGAVVLIRADEKSQAAELVRAGLELDPENKALNELLGSIYTDAARDLIKKAEEDDNAEAAVSKSDEAIDYLDQVLERRPDDAELFIDRGMANLTAGAALVREWTGEGMSPDAVERFRTAAADLEKAASMLPAEGETRDTHLYAQFYRIQALLNAGDFDASLDAARHYLTLAPTDAGVWQLMAQTLVQQGNTEATMMALTVSKSLSGTEVQVPEAKGNAIQEEKALLDAEGNPDAVWTYQEAGSGDQIRTWFWFNQKKAVSFKLGLKIDEISWAM